jgi:ribonuclease R
MLRKKKFSQASKATPSTTSIPYDKLLVKLFSNHSSKALSHKQICTLLKVKEGAQRKLVFDKLIELTRKGVVKRIGHSEFSLTKNENLVHGSLSIVNSGVGFVSISKEGKDIFISPPNMGNAMDGDQVEVRILKSSGKRIEGEITQVIARERTHIVGRIRYNTKQPRLIPDNPKLGAEILLDEDFLQGAQHGDRVIAKIVGWPAQGKLWGEVVETLSGLTDHDSEMLSILCYNGISFEFPQEVLQEAQNIITEITDDEVKNRRDFKQILTFTIDPADAKDFDDALSFHPLENGNIEVGIHIADVGHYVKYGGHLDKEAQKRGNSVYLADRVIPMLPEQLSNIACSLRPNEDKYCFSVVLEFDKSFDIVNEWFGKTRIYSDHRFTYEEAQEIIENNEGKYSQEILILDKIAKHYRSKRLVKGALDIESEEVRFRFDKNGEPSEVMIKRSKDAHKLIEEFMLLANKKVAEFIGKPRKNHIVPTSVYRVHDLPDPAKIDQLKVFLDKFGLTLNSFEPKHIAKNLNALFDKIKGNAESGFIQSLAIRTMAKAAYDTENIGHYGLSFEYYSHFTSPIRRYADLVIHRILQEELTSKKHLISGEKLQDVCKHISKMERKAADAERESAKYFQTLFVADQIGETFSGVVTGIADHGLFVRMNDNLCEGMVPIQDIPGDRFYFDQNTFRIIGAKTKKEFNFGDTVKVRIVDVKPKKRQIDLELL